MTSNEDCQQRNDLTARLERRLERERRARAEAEKIAEQGLRDLYEAKRNIDIIGRVAAHANHARDIGEAVGFALEVVLELTGWPFGSAHAWSPKASVLLPALQTRALANDLNSLSEFTTQSDLPIAALNFGREDILASGAPIYLDDISRSDLPLMHRMVAARAGMRSAIFLPVRAQGETAGFMQFMSPSAVTAREPQQALLMHIADQVARVYERQRMTERLLHDALHDPLTGLANRQLLVDRLSRAVKARLSHDRFYSLLFLDLDKFKAVNDQLGHAAGDAVLVRVGERIRDCIADTEQRLGNALETTVARIGGDEFCVLIESEANDAAAFGQKLAAEILDAIAMPMDISGGMARVGVSIGIAPSQAVYEDPEATLKNADTAMYAAKAAGRSRVQFFDDSFMVRDKRREALLTELREAAEDSLRGFSIDFQPIVDISVPRLNGFEALMRWRDARGTSVSPAEFIPLAEESELIDTLGTWILDGAIAALANLNRHRSANDQLYISINVSPKQLRPHFPELVRTALAQHAVPPDRVTLEVTEGVILDDTRETVDIIEALRVLGVNLSIDDFGSGYATFSTLQKFAFQTLKIDRSFIATVARGSAGVDIVRAIVEMARGLGVSIVAEGAESQEQVDLLREMGCRGAQGFYFSKPLPYEEAASFADMFGSDHMAAA